jgi:CBS-domain-containing membrane protein
MKQVRVRDIMTTDVFTLSREELTLDAARKLGRQRVSGAPVVERGRILGVVSTSDLLDLRDPRDPRDTSEPRGSAGNDLTVNDVMTHLVFAVRPGDSALLAVRLMVEEGIHRAIVVDEAGKLAGIVTPMDVLRAMARGAHIEEDDAPSSDFMPHAEPAVAVQYTDLRAFTVRA